MPYRLIPRRVRARLGHRGAILASFGVINILYGLSIAFRPPTRQYERTLLDAWMSRFDWGWCWAATGAVALFFAFVRPERQGRDWPGFVAAIALPLIWFGAWLSAGIVRTESYAILGSVIYLVWVVVLMITAGWPEPVPHLPKAPPRRKG